MSESTISYVNSVLRIMTSSAAVFAVLFFISKPHIDKNIEEKIEPIIKRQNYISYILMESLDSPERDSIIKKWKSLNEEK